MHATAREWLRQAIVLLALVVVAAPLAAQAGSIEGTVRDSAGGPVAGAIVTLERSGQSVTSDAQGRYALRGVSAGRQAIAARSIGFLPRTASVTVSSGTVASQDLILARSAVELSPVQVVIGSRARHTAAEELAVPVDVIPHEVIMKQGTTETSAILQSVSPSVNFPRQSVTDADDIVRPFTLRGLSPDQTLVLVNGFRRHRTALVHIFAYGTSAGSTGVDLNALPSSAIDRIEILRDGAAAQYGSDAIAGVVNLVLRDGAFNPQITADAGRYTPDNFRDDGTTVNVNGAWGIKVGRGALDLFGEFRHRDPTNRAFPDNTDQIVPGDGDRVDDNGHVLQKNNPVAQPNYHWGDGLAKDVLTMASFRLPVNASGSTEVYAFGGWSSRVGTGNGFRRVGLDSRNWPEIFPLGYLPEFHPNTWDVSGSGGIRGTVSGWNFDVGATGGRSIFRYNLRNTLNVSLGPCLGVPCAPGADGVLGTADDPNIPNQTSFYAGELRSTEGSAAVNVARPVKVGLPSDLNVAVGVSYRRENYQLLPGELASYIDGGHLARDSSTASPASQVFAGFRPSNAVAQSRGNTGAYLDLETNLTPAVLANVAGRFENYSDFGSQFTGKVALRFQLARQFVLRASGSTGFRAPSLAQSFYSSTITTFILDTLTGKQAPVDLGIFPVASTPAKLLGARPLKAETSINLSGGIAWTPVERLTVTADGYYIKLNDRVILTDLLAGPGVEAILANAGITNVTGAQYFSNALDTRTTGIDLTGRYRTPVGQAGSLDFTAGFNYTKNRIVSEKPLPAELVGSVESLFGTLSRVALERERPAWRSTLTTEYSTGRFRALVRSSWYGKFNSAQLGACSSCERTYGAKALFDTEIGYHFDGVTLSVGARNIFDAFPDRVDADNGFGIFPYPAASPFGYNGRFVYTRAELTLNR